jgi:hypothetical protein
MAEHDNSYKLLFSHPEMVVDLLLGFVKEPWIHELDFSTLEPVKTTFDTDDLRGRFDDVIWRVRRRRHSRKYGTCRRQRRCWQRELSSGVKRTLNVVDRKAGRRQRRGWRRE